MIARRSILAALGLGPIAASSRQEEPARLMGELDPGPWASVSGTGDGFAATRMRFLSQLAGDKDLEHRMFMLAKEAAGFGAMGPLPADLANKRSWSLAFKENEYRKRVISDILDRDMHGKGWAHDRITKVMADIVGKGS